MPELPAEGEAADFFFLERNEPEDIAATLKVLVKDRIPLRFGLDPVQDIQVLTPMQRGLLGVASINAELQALLNPSGDSLVRGSRTLRAGDKVMQVRNNYDLHVFNGDIGRIERIDAVEQQVLVTFDARTVAYEYADLDELVLAYACSIHKSQGSEYPCVVIPLHTQHYMMLQRNVLYTAITRGKRLVVLVGSKRALALAVQNCTTAERRTRLAERLRAMQSARADDGGGPSENRVFEVYGRHTAKGVASDGDTGTTQCAHATGAGAGPQQSSGWPPGCSQARRRAIAAGEWGPRA
jgi:exodeoxyribonuclease V alpha subunit